MTDQTPAPLTDQQLTEYEAIAARATTDPFYVSDCEGSLQVWRESALVRVRRDENGEISMYSFPSSYRPSDQVIEIDLDSWDPGEDAEDDQRRQDITDLVDARAAVGVMAAEIRRLRAERDELSRKFADAAASLAEQVQRYGQRQREHNADREELERLRSTVIAAAAGEAGR